MKVIARQALDVLHVEAVTLLTFWNSTVGRLPMHVTDAALVPVYEHNVLRIARQVYFRWR